MDFLMIFFEKALIQININLHPSSAGIGRRLKTPRFILITAPRMKINFHPSFIHSLTSPTIPIGPLRFCSASSLSLGVSGRKIFPRIRAIHFPVRILCTYIS